MLQVPDNAAGRKVHCPKCSQRILVPTPAPLNKIEESVSAGKSPASAVTTKPSIPVAIVAGPAKGNPAPPQTVATPIARFAAKRFLLLAIACLGGLTLVAVVIAVSWALIAARPSATADNAAKGNQFAENPKDKAPQDSEPLKKEAAKEPNKDDPTIAKKGADKEPKTDPPIVKKEPDNAKEAEAFYKMAKAAQEKAEAAEKRAAELLAKAEELEKKNDLDRRKIADDMAALKKEIKAEKKTPPMESEQGKAIKDDDKKNGNAETLTLKSSKGFVDVSILSAKVMKVRTTRFGQELITDDPFLVLRISVNNNHSSKPFVFDGWQYHHLGVSLKDNFGNQYAVASWPNFKINGA